MKLGRVIGTVVTNTVTPGLEGTPFLWVQPVTPDGKDKGSAVVCADGTRMAGPDTLVYFEGGREAAMSLDPAFVPVDHAIIGIVDTVNQDGGGA